MSCTGDSSKTIVASTTWKGRLRKAYGVRLELGAEANWLHGRLFAE